MSFSVRVPSVAEVLLDVSRPPAPAHRPKQSAGPRSVAPLWWALAVTTLAVACYLVRTPPTPDLAAQVARADLARQAGAVTWWTGWFGGLALPTYSAFVPVVMAAIGVSLTGAAGVLLGTWATSRLATCCRRPRAAAVAAGLAQAADLLAGRVTFAVGIGLVLASLALLQSKRSWWAAAVMVAGFLASPLAGLFGGIAVVAVLVTNAERRMPSAWLAASLLLSAGALAFLFPGTGTMPIGLNAMAMPAACCAAIILTCPNRTIRVGAALTLAATAVLLVAPGAVGGNIARLVWVFGVPAVIGCARLPSKYVVVVALLVASWPLDDLVHQIDKGRDRSASSTFYATMLTKLADSQAAAGPEAIGERLELAMPASQWAVVYAGAHIALARGWERQTDVASNPIFYRPGALTATSYRAWLDRLAVGWVALPDTALDGGATAEGQLLRTRLPYLTPVWSDSSWTLYRVKDATPLTSGARTIEVEPTAIRFRTNSRANVLVRVRYSPYFVVTSDDASSAQRTRVTDAGGWTDVSVPAAGEYRLTTRFNPLVRLP